MNSQKKFCQQYVAHRNSFSYLKQNLYRDFNQIYTDGSKSQDGVGAAFVTNNLTRKASLPREASVYSAEVHAIHMATEYIETSPCRKFVIFSDSLSAIKSMNNPYNRHPIVRRLLHRFHDLKVRGKVVELCWIPSHVGIQGNEEVDHQAVIASTRPEENIGIYYKDYHRSIMEAFNLKRNEKWSITNSNREQKLHKIKTTLDYWAVPSNLTRQKKLFLIGSVWGTVISPIAT